MLAAASVVAGLRANSSQLFPQPVILDPVAVKTSATKNPEHVHDNDDDDDTDNSEDDSGLLDPAWIGETVLLLFMPSPLEVDLLNIPGILLFVFAN